MLSSSRFADPILDTLLVPEDFAAVSRFCAIAMNPPVSSKRGGSPSHSHGDAPFGFADQSAGGNAQLLFENI